MRKDGEFIRTVAKRDAIKGQGRANIVSASESEIIEGKAGYAFNIQTINLSCMIVNSSAQITIESDGEIIAKYRFISNDNIRYVFGDDGLKMNNGKNIVLKSDKNNVDVSAIITGYYTK